MLQRANALALSVGALLSVVQMSSSVHLAERYLGMDLANDSLLHRCHESVDFQELLPKSPGLHTDPNSTAIDTELARLLSVVNLTTDPSHR
jgi:hypothetical protein